MGTDINELTFKVNDIQEIKGVEEETKEVKIPPYEELLIMKGRVDAFTAYVCSKGDAYIDGVVIAAMLDFELPPEEAEES